MSFGGKSGAFATQGEVLAPVPSRPEGDCPLFDGGSQGVRAERSGKDGT